MRTIEQSHRFKRDLKREAKGQYKQFLQLNFVATLATLGKDQELPARFFDHDLTGNWSGYRECHLKPDLLLVYRKYETEEEQVLYLARLGSHSELF